MGFIWTPIYNLATRDLRPELAGIASGVLNTTQELGGVIAGAAIGALLQNRLATSLHDEATQYAVQLPPQYRERFVTSFNTAASTGLDVGRGQSGGSIQLPPGIPARTAHQVQDLGMLVFRHGFVDAMRPTLVLPIALILLAAASCFAVRRGALAS